MYTNTHSCYSLRYGTIEPQSLLKIAHDNNISVMALTDINNTSACLDFIRMAPKYQVKPVVGIDFRNGVTPCFVALARNNKGFGEINTFLSHHLHHNTPIPGKAPRFEHAYTIYPFATISAGTRLAANEFIGIHPREVNQVLHSQWANRPDKWVILSTNHIQEQDGLQCTQTAQGH